jgi:predicted Rossmann fold flavoprotein
VRVSGGGRCNVTHSCFDIQLLATHYPRGEKQLKSTFSRFMVSDTIKWFEARGVQLKTEPDGRMFPITDSSQTIIDCLMEEAERHKVRIEMNADILKIACPTDPARAGFGREKTENGKLELSFRDARKLSFDNVLIATGGSPTNKGFEWLTKAGLSIISPVPSLFTFNMPGNAITELMGIATEPRVKILNTKFEEEGPLLITHWGMSGPVVLKLSALAARTLAEMNYQFAIQINWLPQLKEDDLRNASTNFKKELSLKSMTTRNPFALPARLWEHLIGKAGIDEHRQWSQLSKEQLHKLVNVLLYDHYDVKGKTTFKEEFVTCGGVALNEIDFKTMESKKIKGLYFAGEVLDIDGVTGGFNFQSAWTTGYIAATAMGK